MTFVISLLDKISNFRITSVEQVNRFFGDIWLLRQKEMIISFFVYILVTLLAWLINKNWKSTKYLKRQVMWSGFLRSIMMTWFATALMVTTWFYAVNDGFENTEKIHG